MGQGHSSNAGVEGPVAYHPSAVGYSTTSTRATSSPHNDVQDHTNGQTRSSVGPMRNRVKSKQSQIRDQQLQQAHLSALQLIPKTDVENGPLEEHREHGPPLSPRSMQSASAPLPAASCPAPLPSPPQVVVQEDGQPDQGSSSIIPASPDTSSRGEHRISVVPRHPSIIEVPEPETNEARAHRPLPSAPLSAVSFQSPSDRGHTPEPIGPPLADALKTGLGKRFLSVGDALALPRSIGSAHGRGSTDESNRQTLLAFWEQMETEGTPVPAACQKTNWRHSWSSGQTDGLGGGSAHSRSASPYRTVAGRWTSQWEDRRGLGISDSSASPSPEAADQTQGESSHLDTDEPPVSPTRLRRKPVPDFSEDDYLDPSVVKSHRDSMRCSMIWPAQSDDIDPIASKHHSQVSRASATTDALHSHVEKLRAGPSYQVDPSASSLLLPLEGGTGSTHGDGSGSVVTQDVTSSPTRTRARGMSLMAKIKGRVRKGSNATLLSSPVTSSPSTPGLSFGTMPPTPLTPAAQMLADQGLISRDSISGKPSGRPRQMSVPLLDGKGYTAGPHSSMSKRAMMDAVEARLTARPGEHSNLMRISSSESPSPSDLSNKSPPSGRSREGTAEATSSLPSLAAAPVLRKKRSNSHPLPRQGWWKSPATAWSRRGSVAPGARDKAEQDQGPWVDGVREEQRESIPSLNVQKRSPGTPSAVGKDGLGKEKTVAATATHSPTGTELLALEAEHRQKEAVRRPRGSPPLALIGRGTTQSQDQLGYGAIGYSSSSSTFSSLAPAPAPAPVPPPRRARKVKRQDSSSNGDDSSTSASPLPLVGIDRFEGEHKLATPTPARLSPLSAEASPHVVAGLGAFAPIGSPTNIFQEEDDRPKSSTDAESKEMLLSDGSGEYWEPNSQGHLQAEAFGFHREALPGVPSIFDRMQSQGTSTMAGGEEDEEDGHTVTGQSVDAHSTKTPPRRSLGVPIAVGPVSMDSPRRRPLPTPPVPVQPQAQLQPAMRGDSVVSDLPAPIILADQAKNISHERSALESTRATPQRKPLPLTPDRAAVALPERIFPDAARRPTPSLEQATHEIVRASDAAQLEPPYQSDEERTRQSWTSADGAWDADVVALPHSAKEQTSILGFARPTAQPSLRATRQKNSSSLVRQQSEEADTDVEPVPFAETAVQASLAALQALERLEEEDDDWRSQWTRKKLLGSSVTFADGSRVDISLSHANVSMSGLSDDYFNSRNRRRAAPYQRNKEENSSSADERARRHASRRKKSGTSRHFISSSASLLGETSTVNGAGLTSDSDHANSRSARKHKFSDRRETILRNFADDARSSGDKRARRTEASNMSSNLRWTGEDWDEKIVPALAKRLELEAEQEASMAGTERKHYAFPSHSNANASSTLLAKESTHSLQETRNLSSVRGDDTEKHGGSRLPSTPRKEQSKSANARQNAGMGDFLEKLHDEKMLQSRRSRPEIGDRKDVSASSTIRRTPKNRRGYQSSDILAWQSSLGVASAPIATLVE